MKRDAGHQDAGSRRRVGADAGRRSTRRAFLLAAAVWPALAWTGAVCAQAPAKIRRIGLLSPWTASNTAPWHQAFRLGLRDLGWVEGKNIIIEYRYGDGKNDRIAELTDDLVRLKLDVIVYGTTSDPLIFQKAAKAIPPIPVVIAAASDPVATGLAESLARPGGNITGLSQMTLQLNGKRLELLKEMVPKLSRVAVLWNPQTVGVKISWNELQLPARQLGLQLQSLEVRSPNDFDKAFEDATKARAGALFILPNPVIITDLKRIADLALKNRLPSILHISEFAEAGGLLAYGPDRDEMFRRAATYVDKILKGAKPGDLPFEQPTKFEMVINMKTAKALGLKIPNSILVRADKVIE